MASRLDIKAPGFAERNLFFSDRQIQDKRSFGSLKKLIQQGVYKSQLHKNHGFAKPLFTNWPCDSK